MTNLPSIRQVAKEIYNLLDPLNIWIYRRRHHFSGPIPPARNRARIGSRGIGRFMEAGQQCYRPIRQAMEQHAAPPSSPLKVLDFGAGAGRTLQFFVKDGYSLSACDVDESAIQYLSRAYPTVACVCNRPMPPLDFPSGGFDVVYSVSVLTHLPLDAQGPWLEELGRVLKPGGLALLTTMGLFCYDRLAHTETFNAVQFSRDTLIEQGISYTEYRHRSDTPGTGASYGATYHTADYIRGHWRKYFDVLDIREGVVDNLQDLVILRKR